MTYRQTLDFLYAQLPMYHRIGPAAFKKDLTNTLALCEHLGNPHTKFRSVHVGGTNGKGSVSHFMAAIFQAAGFKTGLYISPHYKDFRERIKINGEYIPKRRVADFVSQNFEAIEKIQPSFFELCVAMAFDHFAQENVDIAVVEVGLGGRLDSTNVITPLLSVITNISFDHVSMLGDTLEKIAGEKAGIVKPGIPAVIGEEHPETMPVFLKKAAETGSTIFSAQQNFRAVELPSTNWQSSRYNVFKNGKMSLPELELDAGGPFQSKNLATTLQAFDVLKTVDETAIRQGLKNVRTLAKFQGRWQVIGENPTVLCDSAHNEAGLRSVFEKINSLKFNELHVVTGFVNDKDVSSVLPIFPKNARYYFAKANIPRGLDAEVLRQTAANFGLRGRSFASVKNALRSARRNALPGDLVLVLGSIFVVAEVL